MIGTLIDAILRAFELILGWSVGLIEHVWAVVFETARDLYQNVRPYVESILPDALWEVDWTSWAGYMQDLSWIFPVYELSGIIAAGFGARALIRLVRWILGIEILGFSGGG